jgi:hypothetical protein
VNSTGRALVTIGVPVYNGAQFLAEALRSALAQDYEPLEIIVFDNASTDDTETITRSFDDPRLHYIRNETNIGAVANFRQALRRANGEYFTWLAHDDVLADRGYIRTTVACLENDSGMVACASGLIALDYEGDGTSIPMPLPQLAPERPWHEARLDLFRWPPTPAQYAIQGVFRREALLQVIPSEQNDHGPFAGAWFEMLILTALCRFGRVVALPACLRGYRISSTSVGQRIVQAASPFRLLLITLSVRLAVIRHAWAISLPPNERRELLTLTIRNLFLSEFGQSTDFGGLARTRGAEWESLHEVATARAVVIRDLRQAIVAREALVRDLGRVTAPSVTFDSVLEDGPGASADIRASLARVRSERADPLRFFRRHPAWLIAFARDLNEEIGTLRRICNEQLVVMQQLDAQAKELLTIIENAAPRSPAAEATPPGA